jgi:hypothetical protein
MVFSATFNNISVISWQSVLLMEETGVPGWNHRPVASYWQTLSHNVVIDYTSPWTWFEITTLVVIGTDCTGGCKSNFHTITSMMAPQIDMKYVYKYKLEVMIIMFTYCTKIYMTSKRNMWFSPYNYLK